VGGEDREVQEFVRGRAAEIERLPWVELDSFGKREESFTASSGRRYRIVSRAFWDLGDHRWETDMEITVAAYAPGGWHRWWPYRASLVRAGPPEARVGCGRAKS
jgi:hypothetical protein